VPHNKLHCNPTTTSRDLKIVVYIQQIQYNVPLTKHNVPLTKHNVPLNKQFSGDKIEKNEIGGACSAYGGEERRVQSFGGET
jgi:hypothetical protein